MHSTVLILFTAAVLLHEVNGHLFQRAVPHVLSKNVELSKIFKRQTDEEIDQCVEDKVNAALEGSTSAVATACRRFASDEETGTTTLDDFRTFCEKECGNAFLNAGDECKLFEQEGYSEARDFLFGLCGTNSNGDRCFEIIYGDDDDNDDNGTDISNCIVTFLATKECNCQSELSELYKQVGCCLNTIYDFAAIGGFFNQSRALYAACDATYPAECSDNTLSGVVPQVALITLISAFIFSVLLG